MIKVETFEFDKGSRLRTIEIYGICRLYSLKILVIPYTVDDLAQECFDCLPNLTDLYYCNTLTVINDVFKDYTTDFPTRSDVRIHVPRSYGGTTFATKANLIITDFSQKCGLNPIISCKQRNTTYIGISLYF